MVEAISITFSGSYTNNRGMYPCIAKNNAITNTNYSSFVNQLDDEIYNNLSKQAVLDGKIIFIFLPFFKKEVSLLIRFKKEYTQFPDFSRYYDRVEYYFFKPSTYKPFDVFNAIPPMRQLQSNETIIPDINVTNSKQEKSISKEAQLFLSHFVKNDTIEVSVNEYDKLQQIYSSLPLSFVAMFGYAVYYPEQASFHKNNIHIFFNVNTTTLTNNYFENVSQLLFQDCLKTIYENQPFKIPLQIIRYNFIASLKDYNPDFKTIYNSFYDDFIGTDVNDKNEKNKIGSILISIFWNESEKDIKDFFEKYSKYYTLSNDDKNKVAERISKKVAEENFASLDEIENKYGYVNNLNLELNTTYLKNEFINKIEKIDSIELLNECYYFIKSKEVSNKEKANEIEKLIKKIYWNNFDFETISRFIINLISEFEITNNEVIKYFIKNEKDFYYKIKNDANTLNFVNNNLIKEKKFDYLHWFYWYNKNSNNKVYFTLDVKKDYDYDKLKENKSAFEQKNLNDYLTSFLTKNQDYKIYEKVKNDFENYKDFPLLVENEAFDLEELVYFYNLIIQDSFRENIKEKIKKYTIPELIDIKNSIMSKKKEKTTTGSENFKNNTDVIDNIIDEKMGITEDNQNEIKTNIMKNVIEIYKEKLMGVAAMLALLFLILIGLNLFVLYKSTSNNKEQIEGAPLTDSTSIAQDLTPNKKSEKNDTIYFKVIQLKDSLKQSKYKGKNLNNIYKFLLDKNEIKAIKDSMQKDRFRKLLFFKNKNAFRKDAVYVDTLKVIKPNNFKYIFEEVKIEN